MSKISLAQQQKWLDDYYHSARGALAGLIAGFGIYLIGGCMNTSLVRPACSLLATISAYSVLQVRWIARSNQAILEASRAISAQSTVDHLFLGMQPQELKSQSPESLNDMTILPSPHINEN